MPAYMVFQNRIVDEAKMGEYLANVMQTLEPYRPELIMLEENAEALEAEPPFPRLIVLKFDSRDTALAWYHCAEYQAIRHLRTESTEGYGILCEGFAPPAADVTAQAAIAAP